MANANVGFGLKPINTAGSTPATQGTNTYFIDSAASAIFQGSPVIATNGGEIAVSSSASGDTLKFVGVFAGCEYVSSATGKKFSQTIGPVQARTRTLTSLLMSTTIQCSVTSSVLTLH